VPGPKGASTHIVEFVGALARAGAEVTLATPGGTDISERPFGAGATQVVLGCPDGNPLGRARTFREKLAAWLAPRTFDVLHCRSIFEGIPLLDPRLRRDARLVYEVNGFPSVELKYHYAKVGDDPVLLAKLERQENDLLAAADLVITVSDVNQAAIEARGVAPQRIRVIRNGVDLERFPYRPPPVAVAGETVRLCYVGTLSVWQGVEVLIEAVDLLLAAGASAQQQDSRGRSPLGTALQQNNPEMVERLIRAGAAARQPGNTGAPLLVEAAAAGQLPLAELLLRSGAAVDAADSLGRTPLMVAATRDDLPLLELLLKAGASARARDAAGRDSLMQAALSGSGKALQRLLATGAPASGADAEGNSILAAAAARGLSAQVPALVSAGASVNMANRLGATPLMQAAAADQLAVVEALLRAGADVNLRDKQGDTALTIAARDASAALVKALLGAGANVDLRNNNRANAADIAQSLRRDAIHRMLAGR